LLFTPAAMILAQTVLATPIVIALLHRAILVLWSEYGDVLEVDGASKARSLRELFIIGRGALLTAFLAAFGRAIAEVGAIIIVGGNIRGYTRTMTTAIALETSKGDLPLALGLGMILITLTVIVSAVARMPKASAKVSSIRTPFTVRMRMAQVRTVPAARALVRGREEDRGPDRSVPHSRFASGAR